MPVDYDAIAAKYGGTSAPPAGGGQPDYDAIAAKYGGVSAPGGTSGPSGTDERSPNDDAWRAEVLKNENGQGLYTMRGGPGLKPLEVPHDWIIDAGSRGYDFANEDERKRYKDNARAGRNWDLQDIPVVGNFMRNVSGKLAANLQDVSEVVAGEHPLRTLKEGTDTGETMFANPNAHWANVTGDVLSFLAMQPEMESMTGVARLKAATATLETIEKNPALQRLVLAGMQHPRIASATAAAAKGAPELAAQDLLMGRGGRQAAISGATGAVMPYATEAAAEGVSKAVSGAGQAARNVLDRFKPPTVAIGSEAEVPVEARQIGEEGEILPTGTEKAKTAREQQAAFDRDMQVGSKAALRNSLEQLNAATGPEARPMLPPPSGEAMPAYNLTGPQGGVNEPFEFNLGGPPVEERAQGPLRRLAEPLPAMGTPASYGGPFERTTEAGVTAERRIPGAMHPVPDIEGPSAEDVVFGGETPRPKPEAPAREDVITGGGAVRTTTNPAEAVGARNEYRRLMNSPEFSQFPPEQQRAIREAHDYLTDQIGAFYSQPHGGIIPADIASATEHVVSPGDAADQIRNAVKPGFDELNSLTNGRINQLSDEIQNARSTLWNPRSSQADKEAARQLIARNEAETNNEILRHAGDTSITRQYYNAMKTSYAHASFLDGLNDVIESWSNGISRANTANSSTLKRVISADTESFEKFLAKGNNRKLLGTLMGPQAEETIKSWGQLLADPATARKTGNVLEQVMGWGMRHRLASFAMMGAPFFGYHRAYQIGAAGVGATYGARALMRMAAVSPRVTNLIRYAVDNDVDPRIYSPLISRAVASLWGPQGEQPQPEGTK